MFFPSLGNTVLIFAEVAEPFIQYLQIAQYYVECTVQPTCIRPIFSISHDGKAA